MVERIVTEFVVVQTLVFNPLPLITPEDAIIVSKVVGGGG